jgi:glycosyltransferase involved in cell wall biosynthesis
LKIAHIDTGREMRGGQRQVLLLAKGLRERGHEQVILARRGTPLYEACRAAALDTRPAHALAAGFAADLVHAHDSRAHLLGLAAPRLVVSRRVAFPVGAGLLSRWKYRRASRYLAVSQFVQRQLEAAGVPPSLIGVVYDGVEVGPAGPDQPRSRLVIAPATSDPQKGSDLAAAACREAGAELRFSVSLETDLPSASMLLYLSRSEGLGSAILLAMALGTPVVASRVGGIPEIVSHQHTGLLVDNDTQAVATAIRHVLDQPEEADRRASAARAQVIERFSAARMVAQTEEAYRLVLSPSA